MMSGRSRTRVYAPKRKTASTGRSKTPWRGKVSRKSYSATTKAVSGLSVGLGQSARTVLKTCTVINVGAPASGIFSGYFAPGSCFEPLGVGSGIQPTLFDQWSLTYDRYVVEKAWMKIEVATSGFNAGGTNSATVFAAYPSVNSLALGSYTKVASQDFAKSVLLGPTDVTSTNSIVFKLDHAKVLGRKGAVTSEDNGAAVSANPVAGSYMLIPYILQNPQAAVYNWTLRITLYQTVYFDKRKNVVDS